MASSAPSSPVADAAPLGSAPPVGGSTSTAAAVTSEPSTVASAPPSPPADTSAAPNRDEVALAKAAAEAAATMASAATATDAAVEDTSVGEEEGEEEEAGHNKGATSNPTHNWVSSAVEEGELQSMAFDGVLPPSSEDAPAWRSALGDPSPTPIRDERVLLSSHISRGFSLPPSAFLIEILDHYGLQLHNITPNSLLYISGFVALFEGYLGINLG